MFTRTVNAGDTGITISMTKVSDPAAPENVIIWRKMVVARCLQERVP